MNVKADDVVKFKDAKTLQEMSDKGILVLGWNPEMNYLCGQTRVISSKMIIDSEVVDNHRGLARILFEENDGKNRWYISEDMLELVS